MKKEDLFDTLSDINEQYIKEAHMDYKKRKNFTWVKWSAAAACFAFVFVVSKPIATYFSPTANDISSTQEDSQKETTNHPIADLEAEKQELQSGEKYYQTQEESMILVDPINSETTSSEETTEGEIIIQDVPADENGNYMEHIDPDTLSLNLSDFFGGSYTDMTGSFVVVLTEDTPENRTAICSELGINKTNTTFTTGTYSLAYLTELQEKISNAMINKELPFVTSSGVNETINKIRVCVTSATQADLEKLYALDTIGGAIEIEYVTEGATKDLLVLPAD